MKILNIKHIHDQKFGTIDPQTRLPLVPTAYTLRASHKAAQAAGINIGRDGRAYAPWKPHVRGMRYEKGKLVPRKRAS